MSGASHLDAIVGTSRWPFIDRAGYVASEARHVPGVRAVEDELKVEHAAT